MKNVFLKNVVITISLLLALGYTGAVSAHSQSGSLGVGAGATDLYQVSCFNDGSGTGATYRFGTSVVTVTAMQAGKKISVRTQKLPKATNTTDPVNADGLGSPFVFNTGGDGPYYMTVGKTDATSTAVTYVINFHCQNSAGGHTGTSWVMLQNQ